MTKNQIRIHYKALRQKLSLEDIKSQSEAICLRIENTDWMDYEHFLSFYPMQQMGEVHLNILVDRLWKLGKKVYLPKMVKDQLKVLPYHQDTLLVKNSYGILEPQGKQWIDPKILEVAFLPLLACDDLGNRVGYGKGFYDAFLPNCQREILKIGVNFFPPEKEIITDVSEKDIPLDYCVTPLRIVSFSEIPEK